MSETPVRVLVIDDSPANRRALEQVLAGAPDVEVVDRASDGEEGLRKAALLRPDVITLDLEMPRLDGFSFLRLLMANTPTPVVVVSSYAHPSDVFKALELGACDFVAKPRRAAKDDLTVLKAELLEKIRAARLMRPERRGPAPEPLPDVRGAEEPFIVVVGASTGGPPAIQRLVESVSESRSICLVVAQHMPERFTHAFAERLDRVSMLTVREARDGDVPRPRHVFIAPGGKHLELSLGKKGVVLRTVRPLSGEKHAPSVDRLFESAATVLQERALALVLTGMGTDGAQGALRIHQGGGEVWAEAEESSVIFGMPKAAIDAGATRRVLPLSAIGPAVVAAARRRRG